MSGGFETPQEEFWAGEFGADYIARNDGEAAVQAKMRLFGRILDATDGVGSAVEFGCNIGLNLIALQRLRPTLALRGYEINADAAARARAAVDGEIIERTIVDPIEADRTFDLAFTKGVLIHISPDALERVYANLAALSSRYIAVCEYYNPTPVSIDYRGHSDRLFKRDFAGELIDRFGLRLIDYGFVYHRDPDGPMDDISWFLLERPSRG